MKNIVFLMAILSLLSCGDKIDSKSMKIANEISAKAIFPSNYYLRYDTNFQKLIRVSSIEDLIYLCDHKNPAVRYYSFVALRDKNYSKLEDILLEHKDDIEMVSINLSPCVSNWISVNHLMLYSLDPEEDYSGFKVTREQYEGFFKLFQK